jgi:hypothetical protein
LHQGLTQEQFNRAILNLKVPWAEDQSLLDQFYLFLDEKLKSQYLMLEEIASAVLDNVQVHIEELENEWLEITFNHLKKNKKLGQLRDAMKFLNYNRDYSCTSQQFIALFRENFMLGEGVLEDYQIKMIMQKYATNTEKAV